LIKEANEEVNESGEFALLAVKLASYEILLRHVGYIQFDKELHYIVYQCCHKQKITAIWRKFKLKKKNSATLQLLLAFLITTGTF
jgi:hypothetical protein